MKKKLWDLYAPIYERAMRSDKKIYQFMYDRIPEMIKGKKVLELATGPGLLAKNVAYAADSMIATDYSDGMIKEAKKGYCPPNLTFEVCDAKDIPYEDDSFDAVIISNALHVMPEPEKALSEIDRVLRDGGLLICPTFVEHKAGLGSRIWSHILEIAGVKFEHQWMGDDYLDWLESNGWDVTFSRMMSARISLMYAECVRNTGVEIKAFMNDSAVSGDAGRKGEIKSAYRSLGKAHSFYDGMMTGSTRLGRFVVNGVWQMDREEMLEYQAGAFEPIPADFKGKILEVPVGTGVLSMPVWKTLPDADITCLDYSEKMMASAEKRAVEMDIANITFRQGDVGDLPFEDESFDAVVSLNGFHAFPDKDAAFSETWRVLRPGGIFCGCFYVEGSNAHTDKRIRQFYVKSGFFTPPFETAESLRERLGKMYDDAEVYTVESIAVFRGKKKI